MMPRPSSSGGGAPSPRPKDTRRGGSETDRPVAGPAAPPEDESTGLPGFRRWSTVYLLVFVIFVFVVVGLTVFSSLFA
jgi:hypothetical protein